MLQLDFHTFNAVAKKRGVDLRQDYFDAKLAYEGMDSDFAWAEPHSQARAEGSRHGVD